MSAAKAAQYILNLDTARCEGDWSSVPELVRKIRKHAPHRICLTATAETEAAIARSSRNRPTTSAASPTEDLDTSEHLKKLLEAMRSDSTHPEDRFQAKICTGWLQWTAGEFQAAAAHFPENVDRDYADLLTGPVSDWTTVCALKGAYLQANCSARNNRMRDALVDFESGIPALEMALSSKASRPQVRYWSELFLVEYCMFTTQAIATNVLAYDQTNALAGFRSWARYWEATPGPVPGGHSFRGAVPRRKIWASYYQALSEILQKDIPLPTGYELASAAAAVETSRGRLYVELKRVEATYESLLLQEVTFPKAEEERKEVEDFIQLVTQNWSLLSGRGWHERDLATDTRESLTRGVMDILYRAATKTYHSTSILRNLFHVHWAVGEFDLALASFDAYLELINKGLARVEKSHTPEPSLDSDAVVVDTMSRVIVALCRYGDTDAVEKARELGSTLEDWLARLHVKNGAATTSASSVNGVGGSSFGLPLMPVNGSSSGSPPPLTTMVNGTGSPPLPNGAAAAAASHTATSTAKSLVLPQIPPATLGAAWQAIGLAQAMWSRVTVEAELRTEIQNKAIRCLRVSLSPDYGRTKDVRGLFALSLLYAERREFASALDILKSTLITQRPMDTSVDVRKGAYWQERALIPMWHLLALCLSARQDYDTALKACKAGVEQFRDRYILFGRDDIAPRTDDTTAAAQGDTTLDGRPSTRNGMTPSHTTPTVSSLASLTGGVVDEMDFFEKESLLELKMTQLSLIELLEGPAEAVNASYELMTLYQRLFGRLPLPTANLSSSAYDEPPPPKSSAGTLRSLKGSIFGGRASRQSSTTLPHSHSAVTLNGGGFLEPVPPVPHVPNQSQTSPSVTSTHLPHRPTTANSTTTTTTTTTTSNVPPVPSLPPGSSSAGVTEEVRPSSRRSLRKTPSVSQRSQSVKRGPSLRRRDTSASRQRSASIGSKSRRSFIADTEDFRNSFLAEGELYSDAFSFLAKKPTIASSFARSRDPEASLRGGASSNAAHGPGKSSGSSTPEKLGVPLSLANFLPVVIFSPSDQARQATVLLVKVWLMVAGFYRRAGKMDACTHALGEAHKLVQDFEVDITRDATGLLTLRHPVWTARKSVDALWGDVFSERGLLSLKQGHAYGARDHFEAALTHCPDHVTATIGLSNVLLDIYTEKLPLRPLLPLSGGRKPKGHKVSDGGKRVAGGGRGTKQTVHNSPLHFPGLPSVPLGLRPTGVSDPSSASAIESDDEEEEDGDEAKDVREHEPVRDQPTYSPYEIDAQLEPAHEATSLPLLDRLAARDRAYGLLSGLTKLGTAWNDPDAWFALARVHEESGQLDKVREILWWCVELEEARGVRGWSSLGAGAYVI